MIIPTGYLTLDKPRPRPAMVTAKEMEAGHVDLNDRLWDYIYGQKADVLQRTILLGVVLPAIVALVIRNIYFHH